MLSFADAKTANAASGSSLAPVVLLLFEGVGSVLARYVVQSLALMLAAIPINALVVRRGLKSDYFIFSDPLITLAGAVLLERLRDLRFTNGPTESGLHCWACTSRSGNPNR